MFAGDLYVSILTLTSCCLGLHGCSVTALCRAVLRYLPTLLAAPSHELIGRPGLYGDEAPAGGPLLRC